MNKAQKLKQIADKKNEEMRLDHKAYTCFNLIILQLHEEAEKGNYFFVLPANFQKQETFPKVQELLQAEGFLMSYDIEYDQWEISWR